MQRSNQEENPTLFEGRAEGAVAAMATLAPPNRPAAFPSGKQTARIDNDV